MRLIHGDCMEAMRRLIDEGVTVHSIVTDPPYGLTSVVKRFGKDGSAPAKSEGPTGVYKRASAGFMGQCYHPDTDILTSVGWRRIGDVREGDVVATLNPATRDVEWQAVEQSHAYPFSGQMVRVGHRSACQVVTPNHNVLLSYDGGETLRFDEARKIGRVFHLFAQANPARGETGDVTLTIERDYGKDRARVQETRTYPAKPFFRFLGLWLGDGAVCNRTDDHPANDFITFSVKKPRKVERLRETLRDLGVRFTETPGARNITFYCYDFVLLETLRPLGGAKEKHIPRWVLDRDADDLEEVYQGLIETDGCVQGKGQHVYHTASRQLADDFQDLCLRTGRSASSKYDPGGQTSTINGRSFVSGESWTLCVLQPGKRLYGENGRGSSNVVSLVDYDGPVFCVGVARHHTLYTRFEGKPVWSGNSWDGTGIETNPETWRLCYDLLPPGGYLLAFGGTRTWHRIASAIEDAGFEIRDTVAWLYGTGFPKSHDVSKGIDREAGAERERVPYSGGIASGSHNFGGGGAVHVGTKNGDTPVTPEAAAWQGWGTALKPAFEPIIVARKPLAGTVAQNVLAHGTGAINIDGCRIAAQGRPAREVAPLRDDVHYQPNSLAGRVDGSLQSSRAVGTTDTGRWPANVVHDGSDEVEVAFAAFGERPGQIAKASSSSETRKNQNVYGEMARGSGHAEPRDDSGTASRFFYCAKATRKDRNEGFEHIEEVTIWASEDRRVRLLVDTAPSRPRVIGASGAGSNNAHEWSTLLFGSGPTDPCPRGTRSTTETGINSTTALKTWNWLLRLTTSESTESANAGTESGGKPVDAAEPGTRHLITINERVAFLLGVEPAASKTPLRISAKGAGCDHPTVKPTELMRWLCRLVTPPGGTVLDPFMGSGSTGKAAALEGFSFIGIEQSADYLRIAQARIPGSSAQGHQESLIALLARAARARAYATEVLRGL